MSARKIYRVMIYSQNRINQTLTSMDNSYAIDVGDLPLNDNTHHWQWAVESFAAPTFTANSTIQFSIMNSSQPNSYSTSNKSNNFVGMIMRGVSYNRYVNFDSMGIPIGNTDWLRSGIVQIKITDLSNVVLTPDVQWSAMICIWRIPAENL